MAAQFDAVVPHSAVDISALSHPQFHQSPQQINTCVFHAQLGVTYLLLLSHPENHQPPQQINAFFYAQMGVTDLPDALTPELLEDDDVIAKLHHALLEVHLEEGALVCPETGRRFPVSQGIPNMLLNEDEV